MIARADRKKDRPLRVIQGGPLFWSARSRDIEAFNLIVATIATHTSNPLSR